MASVPSNPITFHPASFGDFNGRLFHRDGELYRAVSAARADLYRSLFVDGTVARLVERGLLVDTEVARIDVDGFALVLKHRTLAVVSYAYEWSANMLKAAALLTLDLEIELASRGLTLQDAHPWNVLFDGPTPRWVDFGSIVPAVPGTPWRAEAEFRNFYLHPLLLMSRGHHRVARRMLADSDDGVLPAEAAAIAGEHEPAPPLRRRIAATARAAARRVLPAAVRTALRGRLAPKASSVDRAASLRDLRDQIAAVTPRAPLYSAIHANGSSGQADMTPDRRRAVGLALARVAPASAFEVAYESPFYGTLTAAAGVRTVAVGVDESHVDALYTLARRDRLNLLPLVMDVRTPSPAYGLCGQAAAPATGRLAADLVIALDATHHLGVRYRLTPDQVAAGLATFARRALLVDFVDGRHPSTRAYWSADFVAHTPEHFESALRRTFASVERLDHTTCPTFLCLKEGPAR